MHRIGFLGPTSAAGTASRLEALRAGLREQGYVEGENLVIEFRWAEGNYERLPALAAELARLKVELIVTHATPGARAAMQATTAIPIVFAALGDAQATGLVATLARPGGNITGSTIFSPELGAKRLELMKKVLPKIMRIGYLTNPDAISANFQAMELTAKSLKVALLAFNVREPQEFERAFRAMAKQRISAIAIQDDPILTANSAAVASRAARQRILTIGVVEFAEAGGLIGFGVDFPALFRRAATFVDKILKGAKPGDIPVEQPTKFELVINMKTAKALGIKIPNAILVRADKVIE
jgi:putative ABC transport system substrate-binding protein